MMSRILTARLSIRCFNVRPISCSKLNGKSVSEASIRKNHWGGHGRHLSLSHVKRATEECSDQKTPPSKKQAESLIRTNYDSKVEAMINRQVNMELYAAYWYTSLQHHFDRNDVALPGFSKFFKFAAQEELEHADKFMVFQMKRGGTLRYTPVDSPPIAQWTAATALAESIELEKQVTQSIEDIVTKAGESGDHHTNDYLCAEFLMEQYQAIKDLADLLTRVKRAGPGTGLTIIDGELQAKMKEKKLK